MELQMPKLAVLNQSPTLYLPEARSRSRSEKRQKLRQRPQQKAADEPDTEQSEEEVVYVQQLPQSHEQTFPSDEKEQVILITEPNLKLADSSQVQQQQEILPQEVVIVSYNSEEMPSQTGIIAYDQNGQILLIREEDIKSVDSYKNRHFIHTFDGTTYIIDNNAEAASVEPTYILLDKQITADDNVFEMDGMSLGTVEVTEEGATACIVAEDIASDTYGIQDWNDFEIYQAMTSFRIAETSETNSIFTQAPIMSTIETPSSVNLAGAKYQIVKKPDEYGGRQSIEDTLATIGVITTEASNIPPTLQLPSTITDPTITSSILNVTNVEDEDSDNVIFTNSEYWQ